MVKVPLDFIPPGEPDLVALHIYEGPTKDGPFIEIERVTAIGAAGSYITRYTTSNATSTNDWFTIAWENSAGAVGEMSQAIQGGTTSVVQKLIDRVLERDGGLNERIVAQEAEAVIQDVYGEMQDPYDPALNPSYKRLSGLTLLTLARVQLQTLASGGTTASWTAGLVSMKSGTSSSTLKDVQGLLREASRLLGFPLSRVAQMATPVIAGGLSEIVTADISRLMIEVE